MKTYVLNADDSKLQSLVARFLHGKSLYLLRTELRGRMGLPRTRQSDSVSPTNSDRKSNLDGMLRTSSMDKRNAIFLNQDQMNETGYACTDKKLDMDTPAKAVMSRAGSMMQPSTNSKHFGRK